MKFKNAREEYLNTSGIPFDYQLKRIFPNTEESKIDSCVEEYHREKMTYVYGNPKDFPEALNVIREIEKKGIYQIISSSTEENIIKEWSSKNNLEILVLGRESGSKKEHISNITERFPGEKIIFVSDSYGDMNLPVNVSLGVDVPQNKEKVFWENGASNVSFKPVSIKWLKEVEQFLVE